MIIIYLVLFLGLIVIDCIPRRNYYNKLLNSLNNSDKKYLLSEIIEEPYFLEGKILYNTLLQTNKSIYLNIK